MMNYETIIDRYFDFSNSDNFNITFNVYTSILEIV